MPSANDNYASRVALTPVAGGSASFDNTGNTFESGEPWSGAIQRTGWYTITPTGADRKIFRFRVTAIPAGGTVRAHFYRDTGVLNTLATVEYDAVWTGTDGGDPRKTFLTPQFLDWAVNTWYEYQLTDETIAIQIGVTNTSHQGTITVEWAEVTKPANDEWADREVITGDSGTVAGDTEGATFDTALSYSGFNSKWPQYTDYAEFAPWSLSTEQRMKGVVFYSFTPDAPGNYEILADPTGAATDIFCVIFAGSSYATLTHVAWAAEGETIQVDLFAGTEYTIAVAGLNLTTGSGVDHTKWRGPFDLSWELKTAPPNDHHSSPEVLTGDSGSATNTTLEGATYTADVYDINSNFVFDRDVWYVYTPTTQGWYEIDLGSTFSPGLTYLVLLQQNDDLTFDVLRFGFPPTTMRVGLRAGETYYIIVAYVSTFYGNYRHNDSPDFTSFDWALSETSPTNDDFADAELISGASGSVMGTHVGATFEDGEQLFYAPTVWYQWVCPATDFYRFTTEGAGSYVSCAVYQGTSLDDLQGVAFNYNGLYPEVDYTDFQVGFDAVAGTTYYFQILGYFGTSAPTDFTMTWDTATPPPHAAFETPDVLPALDDQVTPLEFSSLGAPPALVPDIPDPDPNTDGSSYKGREVWHKWTAPHTSVYEFTFDVPGWDAFVAIYKLVGAADPENLVLVDKGRQVEYDTVTFDHQLMPGPDFFDPFLYEQGVTYYFRILGESYEISSIDDNWAVESGGYAISWVRIPTPPLNDNISSSLRNVGNPGDMEDFLDPHYDDWDFNVYYFTPSGGRFETSNFDATAQASEASTAGFAAARSVWYFFVGPSDGTFRFWLESDELTDMVMSVYHEPLNFSSPSSPGTLLASDDDSGAGNMPQLDVTMVEFDWYLIHVDSKDNPGGSFRIRWVKLTASPPVNDNFADAIELTGDTGSISGTTVDATVEEFEPSGGGAGPGGSVWYKITTPVDRGVQLTLTADSTNWWQQITLYRGSTLEDLVDASNDVYPSSGDGDPDVGEFQLDAGETYYIQVQALHDDGATFTIAHSLSSLTPPAGDPFESPIDSGTGAGSTPGDTEGATTQAGEPGF